MSDLAVRQRREDRADRLMTTVSGWAALVIGILGIHMWMKTGATTWGFLPSDQWARGAVILAFGLFVMWIWGYWPQIVTRVRQWARAGGLNNAMIAVGLIASLVLVNAIVRRMVIVKVDLTKNKRFTLSPRTRDLLKSLKEPVRATVFIPAGRSTAKARDLFRQYAEAGDKFTWSHVDPLIDQKTLLEKRPKLSQTDLTGAILEYQDKRQDLSDFTEKDVTSAILKMTRDTKRKIVFLKGHGEADPTALGGGDPGKSVQELGNDLKSLEWPIETVDLYAKDAKTPDPVETAVLVISGPERELAPQEQKHLNEYLNKGGRVLLLLDPNGPSMSSFLAPWGIKTSEELVLDRSQQGLVVVEAGRDAHESVRSARRVLFQPLRPVTSTSPAPSGVTVTELLKSGPFSEIAANAKPGKPVDLKNTRPGPIGLAAMSEKKMGSGDDAKTARLVVVGDSTFIADQLTRLPTFYNLALGSGLINYLGEEEALVSIPPKDENTEQAFLTPDQGRLLPLIHFIDFPLLAMALAIMVYLKRR